MREQANSGEVADGARIWCPSQAHQKVDGRHSENSPTLDRQAGSVAAEHRDDLCLGSL